VWLPPRSLLILTGDARYNWCHGIAPRMLDKVHISVKSALRTEMSEFNCCAAE
jgi:hypothetical protein